MEKTRKKLLSVIVATLSFVGMGLLVAGFIVNPQGEIHSSVLIAFGECFTFVAAGFGIDYRSNRA